MALICDTGPLIALAKINQLGLLREMDWDGIVIPQAVLRELLAKVGPESDLLDSAINTFIRIITPDHHDSLFGLDTEHLDAGEKQVITLGLRYVSEGVLLIDDRAGRMVAGKLGLPVLGTAGLLMMAKREGKIENVLPWLELLRRRGYWLSDELLHQVSHLSGET